MSFRTVAILLALAVIIGAVIMYFKRPSVESFKNVKQTSKNSSLEGVVSRNQQGIEKLNKKLIKAQERLKEIEKKQKKMDNMVKKGQKIGNKAKNKQS